MSEPDAFRDTHVGMDGHDERSAIERLSARKRDCLRLAHRRLSHQEIADQLGLTAGTVKTYLADVRAHLGGMSTRRAAQMLVEIEQEHLPPEGELTPRQLPGTPPSGAMISPSTETVGKSGRWLREEPPHFEVAFAPASPATDTKTDGKLIVRALRTIGISAAISVGLVTTVIYAADVMMAVSRYLAGH